MLNFFINFFFIGTIFYIILEILHRVFIELDIRNSIFKSTKNQQINFSENGVTVNLYSETTIQNIHPKHIIKNCKATILHKVNGIPLCESVVKFPHIPPMTEISLPVIEPAWKHVAVLGMENYTTEVLKLKYDHYYDKNVEKVLQDSRKKK